MDNPRTRKLVKITWKPSGGWGILSSPGICIASSLSKPIFLSMRWSWEEILDLSHPEIFSFSARAEVPAAMFLARLVLGGMVAIRKHGGVLEQCKTRAMAEVNELCGGAKGKKKIQG
jgi:hypothetical protein